MKQASTTPSPTPQSLQALCEHIECEAPWLHIVRCIEQPYAFVEVKDTSNLNIHVAFSSQAEFTTYLHLVGKGASA